MSRSLYGRLLRRFRPQPDGPTRREMLRATLAAGAGLLLSNTFAGSRAGAQPTTGPGGAAGKRVCVIGGGFSGLACAYELKSAGYDVSVVEARGRIGGRVLSFSDVVPNRNVEGGAEFIGSNHPVWVAYRQQFGLDFLDVSDEKDPQPVLLNGKRVDDKEAKELLEEMEKIFNLMNADAAAVNEEQPWLTPKAAEWDQKDTAGWLAAQEGSALAKAAARAELEGNNTVALNLQSYLGNLAQVKGGGVERYWTDTEVFRCKGGNDQLAMKLAKAIGIDRVALDTPVSEVQVKENGAVVTCGNGRKIECDDVVLTAPPSTWGAIRFDPPLPANLTPQMGKGVKYLARVKGNFWAAAKQSPDALTDGDISLTWDGTDKQEEEEKGACLVVFSGGPAGERCLAYPKETRDATYAKNIGVLYPDYEKNFVAARMMDWPNDRWTKAIYSFPAPGQITAMGKTLYDGVGRLHFAGEATCYKFVGYMEGGLNSGAGLARRLAQRDGLLKAGAPDVTKPVPTTKPASQPSEPGVNPAGKK